MRYGQGSGIGVLLAGKNQLFAERSAAITGICVDGSGNVYVSDPIQHIILKITPAGQVRVYAGKSGVAGNNANNRVTVVDARFNEPRGLSADASGNIFVADTGNNQIRRITPDGYVTLVAGSSTGSSGLVTGIGSKARFNEPTDIAVDSAGRIFVADRGNHAIRMIIPGTSQVSLVAGNGLPGDSYGIGIYAQLNHPYSVAVNPSGVIYICDSDNHKIKILDGNLNLLRFSGSGVKGDFIGDATTSQYNDLKFSDIDRSGNFYVVDFDEGSNSRLLRINQNGIPAIIKDYAGTTEGFYVVGVGVNRSGHLFTCESVYIETEYTTSSSSSSIDSSSSSSSSSSSFNDYNKVIENGDNRITENNINMVHENPVNLA